MSDPTDAELVEAAQAGDRRALEDLLRRHQQRLHAVCRRLCDSEPDALDATQEALIAVVKGLPRFDGRSAFTTWSYRVATNACLDELRRKRRRPARPMPAEDLDAAAPGLASPDESGSIDARLELDEALATVPEDFRIPVVLRDVCQLDYAEIAEVLGIPPGTVRSRIARGRAALRLALEGGNRAPAHERPNPEDG